MDEQLLARARAELPDVELEEVGAAQALSTAA
jgi:hypothetical protein